MMRSMVVAMVLVSMSSMVMSCGRGSSYDSDVTNLWGEVNSLKGTVQNLRTQTSGHIDKLSQNTDRQIGDLRNDIKSAHEKVRNKKFISCTRKLISCVILYFYVYLHKKIAHSMSIELRYLNMKWFSQFRHKTMILSC